MKLPQSLRVALIGAALATASGCATYRTTYQSGLAPTGAIHEETAAFYVAGLIGDHNLDLKSVCPEGVASVTSKHTFVDQLLTYFTLTIYSPMTLEVRCASGHAYQLNPDPEKNRTEVQPVVSEASSAQTPQG